MPKFPIPNSVFMKKLLCVFAGVLLAICGLTSCGNNEADEILKRVPADADLVILGQSKALFDNADIKLANNQLEFPNYITSEYPGKQSDFDKINDRLDESGLDISQVAVFACFEQAKDPVTVVKIADNKKAEKFFEDAYELNLKEKGAKIYYDEHSYSSSYFSYSSENCAVVYDGYVYFGHTYYYDSKGEAAHDLVLDFIKSAEKKSFADTKIAGKMTDGNVCAVAFSLSSWSKFFGADAASKLTKSLPEDGYLFFTGNISGKEATIESMMVDAKGNVIDAIKLPELTLNSRSDQAVYDITALFANNLAPVNAKTLRYLNSDTNLAYAINVGNVDFAKMVDILESGRMLSRSEASMARLATVYQTYLDGTVAFGLGYTGNASDAYFSRESDIVKYISLSLVGQIKEGKAEKVLNDIKGLLQTQGADVPCTSTEYGIAIAIPEIGTTVYISAVDDMLIVSNKPFTGASDNGVSSCGNFDNSLALMAFSMPKESPLFTELGIDCGFQASAVTADKGAQGKMVAKVTDTKDNLIPAIVKSFYNAYNAATRFERKRSDTYYDDDYDYDEVVVEEVVAEVDSIY